MRRVVLAELPPLVRRDDGFVEDCGDVGGRPVPIEADEAARDRCEQRFAPDLARPTEEVALDNAMQPGRVPEAAANQEVGGIGLSKIGDVDAEPRLHRHARHCRQIRVADKQVVRIVDEVCYLAHGGPQQVEPKAALDLDGLSVAVRVIEAAQLVEIALV